MKTAPLDPSFAEEPDACAPARAISDCAFPPGPDRSLFPNDAVHSFLERRRSRNTAQRGETVIVNLPAFS